MQGGPERDCLQDKHPDLESKSPLGICKLFFDKDIEQLIFQHTMNYAREEHNNREFAFFKAMISGSS